MQVDILSIIRQVWQYTVHQSYKGRAWWHEDDVVAIFYSLLKPTIDQISNYELFWNWGVKFPDENVKNVDLALVRIEKDEKEVVGYPIIAIEFKFPWALTDSRTRIRKDVEKLARLMTEKLEDYLVFEDEKIKMINKGVNPSHTFLFVFYGGEEKSDSFDLYDQFHDSPVEILVSYGTIQR